MARARDALAPAAGEWAGAASGLLTVGSVEVALSALRKSDLTDGMASP